MVWPRTETCVPHNPPRVGIVVRTKNRPWFLPRALADIAAQEFDDWRVHIVNDGGDPADVTRTVGALPEAVRERVEVPHNDSPRGRSAAANQGVRALETEFVILHDDDDLWDRAFLSTAVAWLDEHSDDAGVVARTEIVYEQPDGRGGFVESGRAIFWPELTEITYAALLQINRVVPIGHLYRRALHDEVGYYREDVHAAEDWEFNLRVAARHRIGYITGKPLAFWMQRAGVHGELGNSMYALAHEHTKYDAQIRDEALREYVAKFGPGLPLYLASFLETEIARIVREEVGRELDRRPTALEKIVRRLRAARKRR